MEVSDTICQIGDSISVVTHRIADESHNLTGYVTDTPKDLLKTFTTPPFEHSDWSVISDLGLASAAIAIAVVIIFLVWLTCGLKVKNNRISKIATSKGLFIFVWLYGFIVYDVGMCSGEYISLLTNAPMAIIYAFKIFLYDSDVSEIHNAFHGSWVYSLNFAVVHFLAAAISTTFIIKHFGFNVIARLRIWWLSIRQWLGFCKTKDLYIFWGLNDASCLMAKSIEEHYSSKYKKDYTTVIIRVPREDDKDGEDQGVFNRLFNILSIRGSDIDKLQRLNCYTAVTTVNLKKVKLEEVRNSSTDIFKDILRLKSLRRIIRHGVTDKIHILALSDNEKANLKLTSLLVNDVSIEGIGEKAYTSAKSAIEAYEEDKTNTAALNRAISLSPFGVTIYCHARYNSVHRVIEDKMTKQGLQIKVIDSSHINVELLKQNDAVLPVKFVDVTPQGRVSSDFNALVVGFSEVGQDSVRFLYEFGAFVSAKSTQNCVFRSNIHIDVVDNRMKDLAGPFIAATPAINTSLSFDPTRRRPLSAIELHNMDCNGVAFYDYLRENLAKLNYIVIATENDELNITLAVRIVKLALRYRDGLEHFCVLVRAHNDEDGHIQEIASFYNRIIEAQNHAFIKNSKEKFNQETTIRTQKIAFPIFLFGQDKYVFSYSNIIDSELENKAINYKESYAVASGNLAEESQIPISKQWHKEFIKLMQLDERSQYSPTFAGVSNLRRNRNQDYANSLHERTKKLLTHAALRACEPEKHIDFTKFSRTIGEITYIPANESDPDTPYTLELLDVLAQTEHLRWNASHEIMGYVFGNETNEIALTHKCIKPWQDFDPEKEKTTLSYDYSVVDLTLRIGKKAATDDTTENTPND